MVENVYEFLLLIILIISSGLVGVMWFILYLGLNNWILIKRKVK